MRFFKQALGDFQLTVLEDACNSQHIQHDFEADHKVQALQSHLDNGAEDGVLEVGFNYIMIETPDNLVLVDTGGGRGAILDSLKASGKRPEQVDHIIITHGDRDHIGGLGAFPDAKIVLPEKAFQMWTNEESRQTLNDELVRAVSRMYPAERVQRSIQGREAYGTKYLPSLGDRLMLVKEDEEFLGAFSMFHTPGHRSDHFSVKVNSGNEQLIVLADAIRYAFQMRKNRVVSKYDSNPKEWSQTIDKINERFANSGSLYFATHLSFPALCRYEENGNFSPIPSES